MMRSAEDVSTECWYRLYILMRKKVNRLLDEGGQAVLIQKYQKEITAVRKVIDKRYS